MRWNTRILLQELVRDFRPTVLLVEENSIGGTRAKARLHVVVSEISLSGCRERMEVITKTASTVKTLITGNGRASTLLRFQQGCMQRSMLVDKQQSGSVRQGAFAQRLGIEGPRGCIHTGGGAGVGSHRRSKPIKSRSSWAWRCPG